MKRYFNKTLSALRSDAQLRVGVIGLALLLQEKNNPDIFQCPGK